MGRSLGQVSDNEKGGNGERHFGRHRKEGGAAIGRIYWKKME